MFQKSTIKLKQLLLLTIVSTLMLGSCKQSKGPTTLKLAHALDRTHSVHQAMVYLAEELEKNSDGKMTIDIYPSGQLGGENQCLELLQIGSLDMTKVSAVVIEGFVEEYKVFGLPYLFDSKEHLYNVLDGELGKQILQKGEEFWLRGLCYYDSGSRSFYTINKPINHPDDLSGLKIRVMKSNVAVKMVRSLGGSPTPISWGELYTALQSGVVDGAENNPPSFYLSRHYEVCKHYSLDEHTSIPDVMLISKNRWSKLTEQEKVWLQDAVDKSVHYQRKLWTQSENDALDSLKAAGVNIIYPDKAPFAERVLGMYDEFDDNKKVKDLIEAIKKLKPEAKLP